MQGSVARVQQGLNALVDAGYLKGPKITADGDFGKKTDALLSEFRAKSGASTPPMLIDADLVVKLGTALAKNCPGAFPS